MGEASDGWGDVVAEFPGDPRCASDSQLEAEIRNGSEDALIELFRRHAAVLYRLLVRMVGNVPDAEDALQETVVRAWKNRRNFDPSKSMFRTWMFTIGRRVVFDKARKRSEVTQPLESDRIDQDPTPENSLIASQEIAAEEAVRRQLPMLVPMMIDLFVGNDEDRAALRLHFMTNRSMAEISREQGRSAGVLRVALHRFLAKVRNSSPAIAVWLHDRRN